MIFMNKKDINMKRFIYNRWVRLLLLILFLIFLMAIVQISKNVLKKYKPHVYYSSMEKAANYYSKYETNIELGMVQGKEGGVYITLTDIAASTQGLDSHIIVINGYSFYTWEKNGVLRYSVAQTIGIPYIDPLVGLDNNYMNKMNTAPGSTEQLVFGTGEELARECAEKTGIEPEFIHYYYNGKQYVVWYIISPDGLDELPDVVSAGKAAISKTTATIIAIFLNTAIILIPIIIILISRKKKKKIPAIHAIKASELNRHS